MYRKLRKVVLVPVAMLSIGASDPAVADVEVGGELTISTDYMWRGVSQTMSKVALQAELDVEHDSGWYGYAWISNVDYTDSATPDDGASVELDVAMGYMHALTDSVAVGVEVIAYVYPGTEKGYDYDYEELLGSLIVNDQHSLTIAYSDNVFGSGSNGVFYALGSGLDLSERLSLGLQLGHYDLNDAYDTIYSYAVASLAGELKSVDWQLSYFTTTDGAEEISYASAISDRVVLALSKSFH